MDEFITELWETEILEQLTEYIRIPNKSPHFDPLWSEHGYMERAVAQVAEWCDSRGLEGMRLEVVRIEGRTPVIFIEVDGDGEGEVLLYGHLDKQPEITGWTEGLGPWQPVVRDGRLYGRGGADDGYAAYASLTAIEALQRSGKPHPRCCVLIEACEESGSYDLPAYIEALAPRIGTPDLVICLDSGCGNYEQLWCTTSLRGLIAGTLRVGVMSEGVHSGDAGGVVPSAFRIARVLLERIDDMHSGALNDETFHVAIPDARIAQAQAAATALGEEHWARFPLLAGVEVVGAAAANNCADRILARTWKPALEITGASGLPVLEEAGNVQRPEIALKLSLRIPPGIDAMAATERLTRLLTEEPPCGARVSFEAEQGACGWEAPPLAGWLEAAADRASRDVFGKPCVYMGEGGSIPFMAMLGERFPDAQFFITGVLGPGSNAHGPNEFLELATARRLTSCVARILSDIAESGVDAGTLAAN